LGNVWVKAVSICPELMLLCGILWV
jgi:hypothetical protein